MQSLHRYRLAPLAAALLLAASAAQAAIFTDDFNFSTSDQSMWGGSADPGTSFDTGFQGTTWNSNTFSFGGITGDAHQHVPGTGGTIDVLVPGTGIDINQHVPGTGGSVDICVPFIGCYSVSNPIPDQYISVHIPAQYVTITNPVPEQYIDTRTGVKASVQGSGQLGVYAQGHVSGGTVGAKVGVHFQVIAPSTVSNRQFRTFSVQGNFGNGSITAGGPALVAQVSGLANVQNNISLEGCFVLAGCKTTSPTPGFNSGKASLVGVDTTSAKPLSVGGIAFSVPGVNEPYTIKTGPSIIPVAVNPTPGIGQVTIFTPKTTTGGVASPTGTGSEKLTLSTTQDQFKLTMSLPGTLEALGKLPVDVLKNNVGIPGVANFGYTLFDDELGVVMQAAQTLKLDVTPMVEFKFNGPVSERNGKYHANGIVDLGLGQSVDLVGDQDNIHLIRRSYFLSNPLLSNQTDETGSLSNQATALCGKLSLVAVLDTSVCLLDSTQKVGIPLAFNLFNSKFTLNGFQTYAQAVPEPEDLALLLGGGLIVAGVARRRLALA